MIRPLTIGCMAMIACLAGRADGAARVDARPSAALFSAIRQVESGGDNHAVGDLGASRGPYQIQRAYWQDACEYGKVRWSYSRWVWDRAKCEQVMRWYWKRYGARTDKDRARIHNGGGPRGLKLRSTLVYWARVKAAMRNGI